ncbi:unnamed protein product [Linum trigynum]|uniref:Gnk2-homologous domain-containing protein n=1 Tax=Linum trigynum TaxID=586398 RepID=A0AAV2CWS2_9ROSI
MALSTAFLVRLLLIITITTTIFFATGFVVSYTYNKDKLCIRAGSDGSQLLNYAWNETRLPGANVQDHVLAYVVDRMNNLPRHFVDLCTIQTFDGTGFYLFVGCTAGLPSEECQDCVGKATAVIRDKCPDGVGAQAVAPKCCVRYETYKFCEL